ncbi:hypothetical protein KIN20_007389, partial [Parelaphostrongylus tenuis]
PIPSRDYAQPHPYLSEPYCGDYMDSYDHFPQRYPQNPHEENPHYSQQGYPHYPQEGYPKQVHPHYAQQGYPQQYRPGQD